MKALLLLAALGWAYWNVLQTLVQRWHDVPDYSHGYFVLPLAAFLAYSRRSLLPQTFTGSFLGFAVILGGLSVRLAGTIFTIEPIEQFSLLITLAGVALLLGGWQLLKWSLPVIGFLIFMIPLPYSIAVARAAQLQRMTAVGSSYLLQILGIPAFAEGNVIQTVIGPLDVAYACSGLQMMVAFLAVTYALATLSRYPLSGRVAILLSAIPIAVVCNIFRITATGIAYQFLEVDQARRLFHDLGGLLLVPLAIGLALAAIALFEKTFPKRLAH